MFFNVTLILHSRTSKTEALYQEANQLLNSGKCLDAIEKYTEVIKLDSKHLEAYANRGLTYSSIPDFFRATDDEGELIDPDQPAWDLAINDYTQAIDLDPRCQHPEISLLFMNRGFAYGNFDQPEEALSDYDRAIEIKPDFAEVYCNRGILHYKQERLDLAEADFKKTLELSPDTHAGRVAREMIEKLERMVSPLTIRVDDAPDLALQRDAGGITFNVSEDLKLELPETPTVDDENSETEELSVTSSDEDKS